MMENNYFSKEEGTTEIAFMFKSNISDENFIWDF